MVGWDVVVKSIKYLTVEREGGPTIQSDAHEMLLQRP